jgi:molybdopterin converting factor small subunit
MHFKIRFMANMKLLMGKEETELELFSPAEPTARDVLLALAKAENKDLSHLLAAGTDRSWSAIRVVRNGRVLESLDIKLTDGDTLALLPLLAAG